MDKRYFNAAALKSEFEGYVLGQDEGSRRIAFAVSSHLFRISAHKRNINSRIRKDNVMLAGPTGCGKTETFRVLRRLEEKLGIPVIMRNAPDYAPNDNWKGAKDLNSIVKELFEEAQILYGKLHCTPTTEEEFDEVCQMASNGIILLDEFDKIRIVNGGSNESFSRDFQAMLLKLTEGSVCPICKLKSKDGDSDDAKSDDKDASVLKVDTSGIMFIFLGAFDGMEAITRSRILKEMQNKEGREERKPETEAGGIGFMADIKPVGSKAVPAEKEELPADTDLTPSLEDMIEYGIMRELAGRIAIRINYKALSVDDIVKIMRESKTSVFLEYQERFEIMGHKLTLDDAAFREIASMAVDKKTGARGLSSIFSELLAPTMYLLSGTADPTECVLRGSDIKKNQPPQLRKLKKTGLDKWRKMMGA